MFNYLAYSASLIFDVVKNQVFFLSSFMKLIHLFIILPYLILSFWCENFGRWIFCTMFSFYHIFTCLPRDQEMAETLECEKGIRFICYLVTKTCRRIHGIYLTLSKACCVFWVPCSQVKLWCQNCCIINAMSEGFMHWPCRIPNSVTKHECQEYYCAHTRPCRGIKNRGLLVLRKEGIQEIWGSPRSAQGLRSLPERDCLN